MVQSQLGAVAISGIGLLFVVVGLYTARTGLRERARSKRIAATETTAIRQLQPGAAEVTGTAHSAEDAALVESPISGRDAVAATVEVEEWESSGQGGGSWETKHEDRVAVPITVRDGTGEVRVELPAEGDLNLETTQTKVGSGDEPPADIAAYLDREAEIDAASSRDIGPLSIGERRRYSEGVIEPGDDVYVLGAAREAQGDWGERNVVIDGPTDAGDFLLSDKSESALITEGKRSGLLSLAFGGALLLAGTAATVLPWITG